MNQINTLVLTNLTPAQLVAIGLALQSVNGTDGERLDVVVTTTESNDQEQTSHCEQGACNECAEPCENDIGDLLRTPLQDVLDTLNDPRFEYRTISSLKNVVTDPLELLESNGFAYETKHRRSDGELLVKLLPVVPSVSTQTVEPRRIVDQIVELLKDPRYTWRTIDTLSDKTGLSRQGLLDYLEANNVAYQLNYRNSDDEEIIALSSRL